MGQHWAIVYKIDGTYGATGDIVQVYDEDVWGGAGPHYSQYASEYASTDFVEHVSFTDADVEAADDAIKHTLLTSNFDDPGWSVAKDQGAVDADLTAGRDVHLNELRNQRAVKLLEFDVMINDLAMSIRTDSVALQNYRQALLDVTAPYKDHATDGGHATALDGQPADWNTFVWPVAP